MVRNFSFCLLAALAFCSAQAGIDFTPAMQEYTSQGINYVKVTLKTDAGYAMFVPPRGWAVRGATDSLQMQPRDRNFVEVTATAKPVTNPLVFNEATVEALKTAALASAPPSNPPAEIVSCEQNVVTGPNPSLEIVMSYDALGRHFERSLIYVAAPNAELLFRFTAPKSDFVGLSQAFRQSLNSWQWIEQKAESANRSVVATPLQQATTLK